MAAPVKKPDSSNTPNNTQNSSSSSGNSNTNQNPANQGNTGNAGNDTQNTGTDTVTDPATSSNQTNTNANTNTNTNTNNSAETTPQKTARELELERELQEARASLTQVNSELDAQREAELERQGKYKELAELRKKQADKFKSLADTATRRSRVRDFVVSVGGVDPDHADDIASLISLDSVKLHENGSVSGALEAVKEHMQKRPKLYPGVGAQNQSMNPNQQNSNQQNNQQNTDTTKPNTTLADNLNVNANGGNTQNPNPNQSQKLDVRSMTPEQYAEYKRKLIYGDAGSRRRQTGSRFNLGRK